jgi:hypothetical protein
MHYDFPFMQNFSKGANGSKRGQLKNQFSCAFSSLEHLNFVLRRIMLKSFANVNTVLYGLIPKEFNKNEAFLFL